MDTTTTNDAPVSGPATPPPLQSVAEWDAIRAEAMALITAAGDTGIILDSPEGKRFWEIHLLCEAFMRQHGGLPGIERLRRRQLLFGAQAGRAVPRTEEEKVGDNALVIQDCDGYEDAVRELDSLRDSAAGTPEADRFNALRAAITAFLIKHGGLFAAQETRNQVALAERLAECHGILNSADGLYNDVFRFFEGKITPAMEREEIEHVRSAGFMLLARSWRDLRAARHVADLGYGAQAMANATSALEAAATIGKIGTDVELAKNWHKHEKINKTPWTSEDFFRGAITFIWTGRMTAEQIEREIAKYKQMWTWLSAHKHPNPMIERYRYWYVDGKNRRTLNLVPPNIPDTAYEAEEALAACCIVAALALWTFAKANIPDEKRAIELQAQWLINRATAVQVRLMRLAGITPPEPEAPEHAWGIPTPGT